MIGELLRLIRVFNDLTLSELAKSLNASASYLSEIESGKKKPTLDFIKQFSNYFKIRPSTILFFMEEMEANSEKSKTKDLIRNNFLKFLKYVEKGAYARPVEK